MTGRLSRGAGAAALLLVAALLVAGLAGAASSSRLAITGGLRTSSARTVAHEEACASRPNHVVIYASDPMRLGKGPAVARVSFYIRRFRGRGRYPATTPGPHRRTAVLVSTARNAATGAATGFYVARLGTITVSQAHDVGRAGHAGSVSGTVHARLQRSGGTKRIRVDGTWRCRIDAASNGVR
jgi:hypothetical protein